MTAHSTLSEAGDPPSRLVDDRRDADWLREIEAGDRAAFESLYKAFYPRLYRFIYRLTRQPEAAEELINETMLVVWERPGSFDYSSKVSTWIFGIAYRKTLKSRSKWRAPTNHVRLDDLVDVLPDRRPSATGRIALENLMTVALGTLPPDQRAVVELTYYHGLHYREIADILGCPENTVKTRMFHARRKLKPLMRELMPDAEEYRHEQDLADP